MLDFPWYDAIIVAEVTFLCCFAIYYGVKWLLNREKK